MAASQKNLTAKFMQVLEYMDGPQAVLLERSADSRIVAVAIDKEGTRHPFFGAAISFDQWERYRRGTLDLRYLFMFPRWKEWFTFNLELNKEKVVNLQRVPKDAYAEEHYIPEAGFFSYDHSEPIKSTEAEQLATQSYQTDGIWDLPDFTEFHHKLTDIYIFSLSLKKFADPSAGLAQRRAIRESFMGHPLRGGSSYVNLYSELAAAQSLSDRLSVGRLQYASPGNVDVRGRFDVFSELNTTLGRFEQNYEAIKQLYTNLYGYLQKGKMLKADVDLFDKDDPIAQYIYKECLTFSNALALDDVNLIYDLTERNALKFAKVLLSYFRRLERYFMFFAEGRVKEPELNEAD
jgi:hypothetical protein